MDTSVILALLKFILGIAALIILHELGHFLAARLFGVEVEEFGIGFPPRAARLFTWKGTQFSLNWIPLGGFVRPKGENDPNIPGGLAAASPWVRLAVLFAGPLTNIMVGLVLGVLLFYQIGEPVPDKVLVNVVSPNSPAAAAGIQPQDQIVAVDGQPIDSMERLMGLISANLGREIQLTVERDGATQTLALTPRLNPPEGEGAMGIQMSNPTRPVGITTAISRGASLAYANARGLLMLPVRMVQGTAAPEEGRLVGYKGMFDIYRQVNNPFWFFMAISISLGVVNLFPIPALDGGRILFTLPEILFRRRIPPQYENMLHLVGFGLLLLLLIYVNAQDFINPIPLAP
jgi:regulator of sigma E protease